MSKKVVLIVGAVVVVGLIGLGGAAYVLAQEVAPSLGFARDVASHVAGIGGPMGGNMQGFMPNGDGPWEKFDAAAEALGMTPEELFAELRAGKTPLEIAEEQGVDLEELRETLQAQGFSSGRAMPNRMRAFAKGGDAPWAIFDAAAEALDMTPEKLFAELRTGKPPLEIIEDAGVDRETFFKDVAETWAEQAVEEGRISEEQADWLLEGIEKGYVPMSPGFHQE